MGRASQPRAVCRHHALLEYVQDDSLYGFWWLVALRGLRRGEAAGLRWQDLDLERRQLTVVNQRTTVGYQIVEGPPKSAASRRTIALDDRTARTTAQATRVRPPSATSTPSSTRPGRPGSRSSSSGRVRRRRPPVAPRWPRTGWCRISTDGSGSGSASPGGSGRGLTGLRERVKVLGGDFSAGAQTGGGFLVRARIPAGDPS
ncbi:hypothetical protein Phou_078250 [Phytohabitans houttuyneae]|uniref:Tyr recombinase domain-containing protein n=1 Tax=Phytohabitans houttuyneae TaxID=1076126 RepID=A0A6V8KSR2_9ACTN|nr:hypothetical protein Phou_078250 [Phytohabitans houttuyneae]